MPALWRQLTWWVLLFPGALALAMALDSLYLLNWVHVLSGVLWTGADLFMGFMVGPVLRSLDVPARTAVIAYLTPERCFTFRQSPSLPGRQAGTWRAAWVTRSREIPFTSGRWCPSASSA